MYSPDYSIDYDGTFYIIKINIESEFINIHSSLYSRKWNLQVSITPTT